MSSDLSHPKAQEAVALLSFARLRTLGDPNTETVRTVKLHQLAIQLNGSLMPLTGVIEIALRNAICTEIRRSYSRVDWLREQIAGVTWREKERKAILSATRQAQRAAYAKMNNQQKKSLDTQAFPSGIPANLNHESIARKRQRHVNVSHGDIISQTTLHFWKRLYSEDYERTLFKRCLKRTFPNKKIQRTDISTQLEILYQSRNRIAHQELVLGSRLTATFAAVEFMCRNLGQRRENKQSSLHALTHTFKLRALTDYAAYQAEERETK